MKKTTQIMDQTDTYFARKIQHNKSAFFTRTSLKTDRLKGKEINKFKILHNKSMDIKMLEKMILHRSRRCEPSGTKNPTTPNQDAYAFYVNHELAIICLADGHGSSGHLISNIAVNEMCRTTLQSKKYFLEPTISAEETKRLWKDSFRNLDSLVRKSVNAKQSGCTLICLVIVFTKSTNNLYIASVGDSLSFLYQPTKSLDVEQITIEDKGTRPDELQRILDNGGGVYISKYAVRVMPYGLAMSRAIGDFNGRECGIISTPRTNVRTLNFSAHNFIMLGSDGIWDALSAQSIVDDRYRLVHSSSPITITSSGLHYPPVNLTQFTPTTHDSIVQRAQMEYASEHSGYSDDTAFITINIKHLYEHMRLRHILPLQLQSTSVNNSTTSTSEETPTSMVERFRALIRND